jgi:hypothetical protein
MCTDKLVPSYTQKQKKILNLNHQETTVVCTDHNVSKNYYSSCRAPLKEYNWEITVGDLCAIVPKNYCSYCTKKTTVKNQIQNFKRILLCYYRRGITYYTGKLLIINNILKKLLFMLYRKLLLKNKIQKFKEILLCYYYRRITD